MSISDINKGASGVNPTASSIGALPLTGGTLSGDLTISTLSASQAVVTDANDKLVSLPYNSTATASNLAQWDSSANFQANRYVASHAIIVSAGGVTTLTVVSAQTQVVTGTLAQTIQLPDANTLKVGDRFEIIYSNSAASIVRNGSGTTLITLTGYSFVYAICTNNSTVAGVWDISFKGNSASTSNSIVTRNNTSGIAVGSVGCSGVVSTGAVSGSTVSATGTVSGAAVSATGTVSGNAISSTTSVTGATISSSGTLSGTGLTNTFFVCAKTALTFGATVTPAFNSAQNFSLTLTANVATFANPSTISLGNRGVIAFVQDAAGSRTITAWGFLYSFAGGVPIPLTTAGASKDFFNYYVDSYVTGAATITIATPSVVTLIGHNILFGQKVQFTTTGALPTGLAINTTYYANPTGANTLNLATSLVNLRAGTYIATSGSQSGIHTLTSGSITMQQSLNIL